MESTELEEIVARARLAPYEASAKDPMWIWPVIGGLVFVGIASWEVEPAVVPIIVTLLYCVGLGALIGAMAKRRGVQPTMNVRKMPATLRRELYLFWALSAGVVAIVAAVTVLTNFVVAGALAGIGIAVLGAWYHRRYRDRVDELVAAL